MKTFLLAILATVVTALPATAQSTLLRGRVVDDVTRAPVANARITVAGGGLQREALTDPDGRFLIGDLPPGVYEVAAASLGYRTAARTDVETRGSRATVVLFELIPAALEIEGIVVESDPFEIPAITPNSATLLSAAEVRRTPGGQLDVSRTLLSLPGVVGGVDNRNDILVRGGGPGENAYLLDGIRVPQINHFATQGATGGALGLVNVDLIRETEFLRGGFPARYGEALSSVLEIRSRPGTAEGIRGDVTLGASEAGLTLDGPVGDGGNWIFSVRRSYLQYLFQALGLPIRPDYWDAQGRLELFPTERDRVVVVGIGAIDDFGIVSPEENDVEAQEIFDRVLDNDQRTYTTGAVWERRIGSGVLRTTAARSWTDYRFRDVDSNEVLLLENRSVETNDRLRVEGDVRISNALELSAGVGLERVGIDLNLLQVATPGSTFDEDIRTATDARGTRTSAFVQGLWRPSDRWSWTAGLRADRNGMLDQGVVLSPRLGVKAQVSDQVVASLAGGVFHQSPSLVSLAVQRDGADVNRDLRQLRNRQLIAGFEVRPTRGLRLSAEAFWKVYDDYPVLAGDPRVSLANLGGEYGFVGGEDLESLGDGRARGVELFAQQKLTNSVYVLAAYTLSESEFSGADGVLKPSAWDVRHALDLTAGWRPSRRWEFGSKLRVLSGRPVTPFLEPESSVEFDRTGRPVLDYGRIGEGRTPSYTRLDLRVERVFDFGGWNGRLYLDVQNVLNRENEIGYNYTRDPAFPANRRPQGGAGLLPFIGFSVEF